ncbi:hypothetical protein [Paenibacillus antarcticus]|uniref:Uncharacterized protein n=1 Tax=Paenibacillus antarcticus TaxID=253703 RepID=A0A168JTK7_9BACL|nr:hypothetical protein [Paenibacillus antarcticus]OAB41084.1 hypothetical protein PBAT_21200 [Paenibacillus antarcticus]
MKRIKPKKFLTLTLLMALVSMLFSIQVSAADSQQTLEPGALTTAPPVTESLLPFAVNSSFKYIYYTDLGISNPSSLKVRLNATISAYEIVNSIGANVSLERYNGSIWVAVSGTGSSLSSVSTDYYSGNVEYTVTAGYYYRGRGVLWAKKGTTLEEVTYSTGSVLVTQ